MVSQIELEARIAWRDASEARMVALVAHAVATGTTTTEMRAFSDAERAAFIAAGAEGADEREFSAAGYRHLTAEERHADDLRAAERRMAPAGECGYCDRLRAEGSTFFPAHTAMSGCRSGRRNHCTCDGCF